jgi:hypothetical protein
MRINVLLYIFNVLMQMLIIVKTSPIPLTVSPGFLRYFVLHFPLKLTLQTFLFPINIAPGATGSLMQAGFRVK